MNTQKRLKLDDNIVISVGLIGTAATMKNDCKYIVNSIEKEVVFAVEKL